MNEMKKVLSFWKALLTSIIQNLIDLSKELLDAVIWLLEAFPQVKYQFPLKVHLKCHLSAYNVSQSDFYLRCSKVTLSYRRCHSPTLAGVLDSFSHVLDDHVLLII
ncbi:hypothetical protein AVEN_99200-1 [Araneus ventricosus]|uniref:Uncharacterized protein n=1 Tax=Araneus ventricosus TaxID=182803 RepID=A0A4Y2CJS1_ARAVE|nr:hypothetical protein AVEN_99200-1 [Araneus ventricosus]